MCCAVWRLATGCVRVRSHGIETYRGRESGPTRSIAPALAAGRAIISGSFALVMLSSTELLLSINRGDHRRAQGLTLQYPALRAERGGHLHLRVLLLVLVFFLSKLSEIRRRERYEPSDSSLTEFVPSPRRAI